MNEIFIDQSHIDRVRKALWHRSCRASVMIGAGFSRCALKARPDSNVLPLAQDLATAFSKEMHSKHNNTVRPMGLMLARDFPSIANDFKAKFGRAEMNRLLKELILDDDFKPGDMHQRLLQLPWRDVFTTNWDTLLERTRVLVTERKYGLVLNKDDIPLAGGPRIIKLHGSFPSQYPFICTEEDYETYPAMFAPFVNTVQQSMMETIFCLIGFSGDDPNFRHWTKWVRSNLGESSPNIYLAGWLDLKPCQRQKLEEQNIVPIDLAHHPRAETWPEKHRYNYAINWILHTLERGRPYIVTDWPAKRLWRHKPVPEELRPVAGLKFEEPKSERMTLTNTFADNPLEYEAIPDSLPPTGSIDSEGPKEGWQTISIADKEVTAKHVKQILDVWAHNRRLYPGWLAAPSSTRPYISINTAEWEPRILRVLNNLLPVEQLNAIRELVWRREILLDPISPCLEEKAEHILQRFDCHGRTIDDAYTVNVNWEAVRQAWTTISLALVTAARHRFDYDTFTRRIESLSEFLNDDIEITQRLHHERCLWATYAMDFPKLENLLRDWDTENPDPMWMVRKAAILYGVGRTADAAQLCKGAIFAMRQMTDDGRSVAGPTREGWALWLAWAIEYRTLSVEGTDSLDVEQYRRRWRELAGLQCDALSERDDYLYILKGSGSKNNAPAFELGEETQPGFIFSIGDDDYKWSAAHRAIRLIEVAGLPSFESGILMPSIDVLYIQKPELAVRMLLHASTHHEDDGIKRALSRNQVARMNMDLVVKLDAACDDIISYASHFFGIPETGDQTWFWRDRLGVAIEIQSRLAIRVEPDRADASLDKAIKYYNDTSWDGAAHILASPIRNMLKRSWEALPKDRRTQRVIDILRLRLVGTDSFVTGSHYYTPGELLYVEYLPASRPSRDDPQWYDAIATLVRGLKAGGEARKRASYRISSDTIINSLTQDEVVAVAKAFWPNNSNHHLPVGTILKDWVFLLFPEPIADKAKQGFRSKWLLTEESPNGNTTRPEVVIYEVGNALAKLKDHKQPLSLSKDERAYLVHILGKWLEASVPFNIQDLPYDERIPAIRNVIYQLSTFVTEINITRPIRENLFENLRKLNARGYSAYPAVFVLAASLPDRMEEIVSWLKVGLASDDDFIAESAVWGLHDWLIKSSTPQFTRHVPPLELVREIGVMIATRRKTSLVYALHAAKWIFEDGSTKQQDTIRELVLQGLEYLCEELSYDRESVFERDADLSLLRKHSAQLVISMSECCYKDNQTIQRWLNIISKDPLPEVRYAQQSHNKNEKAPFHE